MAGRAPGRVKPTSLPYDRAKTLAEELIGAAALDDGGAKLGELAGKVTLDPRTAGTVIGILAFAVAKLGDTAEVIQQRGG